MRTFFITLLFVFLLMKSSFAEETLNMDTVPEKVPDEIKTGWSFGALPAVAYNSDEGFRYGALANFFNFGDGSTYPNYMHSLYLEWSRTTKGNGKNNIFYDSSYLIPGTRSTIDIMYLTEQALDFYGFNGYEAPYFMGFEDSESDDYISRMYYRYDRKLLRLTADFQRKLFLEELNWLGGIGFFGLSNKEVDLSVINEGQDEGDMVPDVPGLYEKYVEWGVIPKELEDGGNTTFLKGGLVYDTRDQQANPMSGFWSDALLLYAPSFLGNGNYSYLQGVFVHRQYFTIIPRTLAVANRIGYQGKIAGDMPYYMLPFVFSSYKTDDGFGGGQTLRGARRNRVQGEGVAYGTLELRYHTNRRSIMGNKFHLAFNVFSDAARIVQKFEIPQDIINNTPFELSGRSEQFHVTLGGGFRIVMNENFIVALDYGKALDAQDGDSGVYIGLNFLF